MDMKMRVENLRAALVKKREEVREQMGTGAQKDSWSVTLLRLNIEIDLLERLTRLDNAGKAS